MTIALVILCIGLRLCACISRIRQTDHVIHVVDLRCRGRYYGSSLTSPFFVSAYFYVTITICFCHLIPVMGSPIPVLCRCSRHLAPNNTDSNKKHEY